MLKKLMARSRGAALAAVVVVLVTASSAVATHGQFPIFMGHTNNPSGKATTLAGAVAGRLMQFTNSSTTNTATAQGATNKSPVAPAIQATNSGGGPALSLTVNSGKAPMRVNSAVKVANLNADKLDGKDSTQFLPSTGKAADADKLDGKDSSAFAAAGHEHDTTYVNEGQAGSVGTDMIGDGAVTTAKLASDAKEPDADNLDGQDSTAFQRRVSASCPAGNSISAVAQDGMVTCEPDDDTKYSAGTGLSLSDSQFSVNFGGKGWATTDARSDHTHTGSLSGVQRVEVTNNKGAADYFTTVHAWCPSGKVVIGGGYKHNHNGENRLVISRSQPIPNGQGWEVYAEWTPVIHGDWSVTAYAICAAVAP